MQDSAVDRAEGIESGAMSGFDYLLILYQQKWFVIGVLALCLAGAYAVFLNSVKTYEVTVVMVPHTEDSDIPSTGAVDTLANLGLLGRTNTNNMRSIALAMLESRSLLQQFITDNNLLPILFASRWDAGTGTWTAGKTPPTLEDGYNALHDLMRIDEDTVHGVIRFYLRWTDPVVAATWANGLVRGVNGRMQAKAVSEAAAMISYLNEEYAHTTIQELRSNIALLIEDQIKKRIMARSRDDFALAVIDPAEPTERPASPRLLVIMAGGALGFFRHGLAMRKEANRSALNRIEGMSGQGWRTS